MLLSSKSRRHLVRIALCAGLSVCAFSTAACRRNRSESPADHVAMLQSPDADERRDAAKDLMDNGGPAPQAVPYLIAALQREQDPKTYGIMLLALGKSGAPDALPYLQANVGNPNKHVRERAEKGLEEWSRRNPNGVPVPPPTDYPPPQGAEPPPPGAPPPPPPPPPPPQPDSGQTI